MSEQDDPSNTLFPIRELCARTQVNSVTLRAWERRYGLLKPQRTSKGHRLYSDSDVKRVEQIVEWIGRGVPVSRVKALLDNPSGAMQPKAEITQLMDDDRAAWLSATDSLCRATLEMSVEKTEHCLNECFLNYPAATCQEKLLEPAFDSLQGAPSGIAAYAFLQSEIIRYVIQRSAVGKQKGGKIDIQLVGGENTPIWQLAITALSLTDAGLRVQLINQPCDVKVWLDLILANRHSIHLVFQDGIWREEEKRQIKSILRPTLWLCGAAPMTSGIAEPDSSYPDFYPTPGSAVSAILNQIPMRAEK